MIIVTSEVFFLTFVEMELLDAMGLIIVASGAVAYG